MSARIAIRRAGPLTSIQDAGRFGMLRYGIAASGPIDRQGFALAGASLEIAGSAGIEFTQAGLCFSIEGEGVTAAFAGGDFTLEVNGEKLGWPIAVTLTGGDVVDISPGSWGNYGYMRFDREIGVAPVLGSRSTHSVVGLGGLEGRSLRAGDRLALTPDSGVHRPVPVSTARDLLAPIRFIWGVHADLFATSVREAFLASPFRISNRLDRMGVRLADERAVFTDARILSLVSDAVVPGDIQILGDGTPIVLMRDHQPTGGYPRIATILSQDLDRFAQLRPGAEVRFQPVSLQHAFSLRSLSSP